MACVGCILLVAPNVLETLALLMFTTLGLSCAGLTLGCSICLTTGRAVPVLKMSLPFLRIQSPGLSDVQPSELGDVNGSHSDADSEDLIKKLKYIISIPSALC